MEESESQVLVIEPDTQLQTIGNPGTVLSNAQIAAKALRDVISKKERPVILNGQQYLEFEDWQTIGQFYGYSVKTGDAVPVEIEGVKGAKATAYLYDRNGKVVGGAEAYCMRDEDNWKDKPWFQLASMSQTRAGSKSYRNRLAWVVVLAGYKPTPAEEMDGVFDEKKPPIQQPTPKEDSHEKPEVQYKNILVKDIESRQVQKKDKSGTFDALKIHAEGGWVGEIAGFRKEADVIRKAKKEGIVVKVGFLTNRFGHQIGSAELITEDSAEEQPE